MGKRVKVPHGPATVIGEPGAHYHWHDCREGGAGAGAISQDTRLEMFSQNLFEDREEGNLRNPSNIPERIGGIFIPHSLLFPLQIASLRIGDIALGLH